MRSCTMKYMFKTFLFQFSILILNHIPCLFTRRSGIEVSTLLVRPSWSITWSIVSFYISLISDRPVANRPVRAQILLKITLFRELPSYMQQPALGITWSTVIEMVVLTSPQSRMSREQVQLLDLSCRTASFAPIWLIWWLLNKEKVHRNTWRL